ncbi:uncharacterized protein LOC34620304 [Cyclospora cayetanensis]|uniref:Uncharacterized protein LOC34620304 n=1 Tax=Cyclospora cayetanensis TaxID=88456 RepID=A0A6P6S111_9EIME|nr:uncharacterized protein LOC34620304 [Cyclospora cayetanensis]
MKEEKDGRIAKEVDVEEKRWQRISGEGAGIHAKNTNGDPTLHTTTRNSATVHAANANHRALTECGMSIEVRYGVPRELYALLPLNLNFETLPESYTHETGGKLPFFKTFVGDFVEMSGKTMRGKVGRRGGLGAADRRCPAWSGKRIDASKDPRTGCFSADAPTWSAVAAPPSQLHSIGSAAAAAATGAAIAATAAAAATARDTEALTSLEKIPIRVVGARVAVQVRIGGQDLLMGMDSCKEGLRLFASGSSSCTSGRLAAVTPHPQEPPHYERSSDAAVIEVAANDSEQQRASPFPPERQRQLQKPLNRRKHQKQQNQACYDPEMSGAASWCLNWHEICTAFSETPFTCRPSQQHDPQYAVKYKQVVDGIIVSEMRLEGFDTVELVPPLPPITAGSMHQEVPLVDAGFRGERSLPNSSSFRLSKFPVKLVLERETDFDAYKGLDGVWGVAGPDICCREASLWNMLLEPSVNAVGFDINLPDRVASPFAAARASPEGRNEGLPAVPPSFMYLAADAQQIFGGMLWAHRMQTGAAGYDGLIHFTTFDWKLCGESVGHPLSNSWEAIVDLSSECLVVPPPMWRSLRAWLPLDVKHELCKDPDSEDNISQASIAHPAILKGSGEEQVMYRRTCPLLKTPTSRQLPALSFSLSQSQIQNPRLQIPLDRLVVHEEGIGDVLCVVPQPFLSVAADQWRQIRFGTRVLSAFNVVMDRANWRVGIREKNVMPTTDAACQPRAVCAGNQTYVPYTNRCADPDCSVKILFEMNPETKVCELAWWVPAAVVTAVAAVVALEVFVLYLRNTVVAEACSGGR